MLELHKLWRMEGWAPLGSQPRPSPPCLTPGKTHLESPGLTWDYMPPPGVAKAFPTLTFYLSRPQHSQDSRTGQLEVGGAGSPQVKRETRSYMERPPPPHCWGNTFKLQGREKKYFRNNILPYFSRPISPMEIFQLWREISIKGNSGHIKKTWEQTWRGSQ